MSTIIIDGELKNIRKTLQKLVGLFDEFVVEYKNRRDEAGCDSCSDKAVSEVRFLDGGPEYIEDGFGSSWPKKCCVCHQDTMYVVRPGEANCSNCNSDLDYKEKPKDQVKRIKDAIVPE